MSKHDPARSIARPASGADPIIHVICPNCGSPKAVIAARHYAEIMCFCPACDTVWDCLADTVQDV